MSKALKEAIEKNDPAAAKKALAGVKDLNRKLPGAQAPAVYACATGADAALAVILDSGGIPKSNSGFAGNSLYAAAAERGHVNVLKVLKDKKAATIEHAAYALDNAALRGQEAAAIFTLDNFDIPLDAKVFRLAIVGKKLGVIKALAKRADLNKLETNTSDLQMMPLHAIVGGATEPFIAALVEAGADINARDSYGRTPLMVLAHQFERMVSDNNTDQAASELKALLKLGADAKLKDPHGNDAVDHYLIEALRSREEINAKLLKLLKEAGAKGSEPTRDLFKALVDRDIKAMKKAIDAGADVNRQGPPHWNSTPLTIACGSDRPVETIDLLIEAGADVNKPDKNSTPLIEAAEGGNLAQVKRLIEAGAKIDQLSPYESPDGLRKNAYLSAEERDQHEVVAYLKSLGAARPKVSKWEPIEAGVGSWNDFRELIVNADAPTVAKAIAKLIKGKAQSEIYGQTLTPGKESYLIVRPKGLKWSNVLQITPDRLRQEDEKKAKKFATDIAVACKKSVLRIEYSDTSDSASIERFEPDGKISRDETMDRAMLEEIVGELGDEAPEWMHNRLAAMGEESEEESNENPLVTLAKAEKFAVAHLDMRGKAGQAMEVAFPSYPADAFDSVAWVST